MNPEDTEYFSLKDFLVDNAANWMRDSDYGKKIGGAEVTLADAVIVYTNYFEDEITELGLNEDFDEYQMLAHNVIQNYGKEGYEEHKKKFEYKMGSILSNIEGTGVAARTLPEIMYDDYSEWAKVMFEMLSKPLDDPKLKEAKNDEGFEYYLKAQLVRRDFPFYLSDGDSEVEKTLSEISLLTTLIGHNQFVRTAHLGSEGQAMESTELVDQWKPTTEEMREAIEDLKDILIVLANKS